MAFRSLYPFPSTKKNQPKTTKQNKTTTEKKPNKTKATKREFFLSHDKSKIHCVLNDNI